ncbi:hypothetical protein BU23DRAFT_558555 [Bimuria novae-zelandiae CBS 107.79]|uniref:3-hydroxyisobutyrate dehydrogenase-like NAD-binding domain-containing protein n=1 Tax=Bimuria novae-zelandiae CBS 107.79 TaxID=1447943 RepID=A0A6A5UV66_9PLEO|nr:hypothetical protein BU23DRAFT_558555 [Bimuria novae-zelandiae CBS 107.79]
MTSVHPNTTTSVATLLRTHHCFLVAAPVFGPPAAAATAQTLIAVAGMPTAVAVVTPLLEGVLCRGVIHAGSDPAQASLLKASSNFIAAGLQFLLSEAHVLAEKAGLPAPVLESLIEQNFGAYAGNTSKRLTSGSYLPAEGEAPNSALELAMKDVCIGLDVARSEGVRLEIGELSMSAMQEAKRWGDERGKRLDSHSVFGVVRGKAGLGYENAGVRERDGVEEK